MDGECSWRALAVCVPDAVGGPGPPSPPSPPRSYLSPWHVPTRSLWQVGRLTYVARGSSPRWRYQLVRARSPRFAPMGVQGIRSGVDQARYSSYTASSGLSQSCAQRWDTASRLGGYSSPRWPLSGWAVGWAGVGWGGVVGEGGVSAGGGGGGGRVWWEGHSLVGTGAPRSAGGGGALGVLLCRPRPRGWGHGRSRARCRADASPTGAGARRDLLRGGAPGGAPGRGRPA